MSSFKEKSQTGALYGTNIAYLEDQEELLVNNNGTGDPQWKEFFSNGMEYTAEIKAPIINQVSNVVASTQAATALAPSNQLAVSRLIDSYRLLGNRSAKIDPLLIEERPMHPSLDMKAHGFTQEDLNTVYMTDIPGLPQAKLSDVIDEMSKTYCDTISAEFMYITDPRQRQWFVEKYEAVRGKPKLTKEEKLYLLERLIAADTLENYLNTKYTGQKRFSLEGGDALIPMMDTLARDACQSGVKETIIGMAHRGRLNVLINILGKTPHELFQEFEGKANIEGSGDVKYHMGFSSNLNYADNIMHMALAFNPSHLEVVNPVVEGSVWARQARRKDVNGNQVLPILIHGDAALSGQGIGMEVLNMSQTRGFATGGTIHITVNNQVGFTISHINDARSTYWCTDLAKMAECPVIHVNGNDPEAAYFAAKLALEYRNKFKQDVFIDLCCYRRHGHNEQDEPKVTQPYMYSRIKNLENPASFYAKKLIAEEVINQDTEDLYRSNFIKKLENNEPTNPHAIAASTSDFIDWSKHIPSANHWLNKHKTSITAKEFKFLGEKLTTVPMDFKLHSRLAKILDNRSKMMKGEEKLDWGMAENLAYASLINDGYGVRISGQDVGRGTFFHRHAVWHDQNRNERDGYDYAPLKHINEEVQVNIVDSLLSEAAVLGFEYGVSLTSPDVLTVWEAQFGDFANNAQVVIDQFITSGEFKWGRLSGLVLLLPHGYEGQGPEHSSARLERYMQLCAEYNIFVCVPTTAAQIFHLLRRQLINPLRRPLIIMSPKSLLRHKEVASVKEEFIHGSFNPMIPEQDQNVISRQVRKLIVCSGKIYYDLNQERSSRKITDIAIVRLEQIYPFPHDQFKEILSTYPDCNTVLWCQEEPGNQGAWHRIQHYIKRHLEPQHELKYSLRKSSASTATGSSASHKAQQAEIIDVALK